ncbi:TonB-dependent receptor [bacterium]|nr:TonB-dependent receptor [bacterium]
MHIYKRYAAGIVVVIAIAGARKAQCQQPRKYSNCSEYAFHTSKIFHNNAIGGISVVFASCVRFICKKLFVAYQLILIPDTNTLPAKPKLTHMRFFLLAVFCFAVSWLFGQSTDTVNLTEVVIMKERMPIKISETARSAIVVTAAQIKEMNAVSLNEVLSYLNGVDLRQRGPLGVQADVGIRGGSFDQTLVLLNGMKVSDPQTGHHALNLPIPVENIERIEVIKGPAARLYGPNAYAGVINIITKTGDENALFVKAATGQHHLYETNATVNLAGKKVKQSLSLAASGSDSFVYNTDFGIVNALYQADAKLGKWDLGLLAAANSKKFGANSFYASKDYKDQYEETKTFFSGLNFSRKFNNGFILRGKIYGRRHQDHYVLFRNDPEIYQNFHTSNVWATEIAGQSKLGAGSINFGIDSRHEQIISSNLGNHDRQISSAYVDLKYPIGKFLLNPGANLSLITGYKPQLFPGIDISYALNKSMRWYASYGTAYRVPTYTDLYYVGPQNIGNANLGPETAWNVESGLKYQQAQLTWSAAVFSRKATNAIEWVRADDNSQWQPRNFQRINTTGLEANVNYQFKQQKVFNFINLSYTYLHSNFSVQQNFESKYQVQMLRHQLVARINHRLPFGLKHNLSVRYLDRYSFSKAYTLVDSRLYYQKKQYNLFVEATNILNTQYRETDFVQMPGRWFRLGGSLKIGL